MENLIGNVSELIRSMVCYMVDDVDKVSVTMIPSQKGTLFEVKVGADDVGKIIGKQGRIANSIRTIAKAAGAKLNQRVMVNILNKS